jgi:hypothetical protein
MRTDCVQKRACFSALSGFFNWHCFCIEGVTDGKGAIDEPKESE